MQDRSERTRRRLVHAGAGMFHRNGYAHATLGGIASAAGVTKGALYFHFASKDELAQAVQERGHDLLHGAVRELREAGASPLQTLIGMTHWLARTLYEDPAVPASFRITKECAVAGAVRPEVADFPATWMSVVGALLRLARESGELPEAAGGRDWEGARALVLSAACGIEVMAGTGMPYAELQRNVAWSWNRLLPGLVGGGRVREYRTGAADAASFLPEESVGAHAAGAGVVGAVWPG